MGYLLSVQAAVVGALLAISVLVLFFFRNSSHIGTGDFIMIVGYISMLTFQLRAIAWACIDIQRHVVFSKKFWNILVNSQKVSVLPASFLKGNSNIFLMSVIWGHLFLFNRVNFKIKEGEMFTLSALRGSANRQSWDISLG